MKQLKFVLLGCGILGIISIFALPIVSIGPASIKLWDVREVDAGQVYLVLAGYLIPTILAGMAVAKGGLARWQGIVSAVFFLLVVIKMREGMSAAIGGKLMLIAGIVGLLASIAAAAKPEEG